MSENSEQTLYEQAIGGSDITELTEESLLTQLFEDIRTSNITKSRKEPHKQTIQTLCDLQAKATIEAAKYKQIADNLQAELTSYKEGQIKNLEEQQIIENTQTKIKELDYKQFELNLEELQRKRDELLNKNMDDHVYRTGLSSSLPTIPLQQQPGIQTQQIQQQLHPQPQLSQLNSNLTTTQLADALAAALPAGQEKPNKFGGATNEVIHWIDHYDNIALSNNWNETKKIQKLPAFLTGPASIWYGLEIKDKNLTWNEIRDKFYQQFLPVNYQSHIRNMIRHRKQDLYETSANYICTLRSWIQKTGIRYTEEEQVNIIMDGMLPPIRQELIKSNPRTLQELQDSANRIERSLRSIHEGNTMPEVICMIQPTQNKEPVIPQANTLDQSKLTDLLEVLTKRVDDLYVKSAERGNRSSEGQPKCKKCGRTNHTTINCKVKRKSNVKCFYCQKLGHVSKECRKKKRDESEKQGQQSNLQNGQTRHNPPSGNVAILSEVKEIQLEKFQEDDVDPYEQLTLMVVGQPKTHKVDCTINGKPTPVFIDTGADVTISFVIYDN